MNHRRVRSALRLAAASALIVLSALAANHATGQDKPKENEKVELPRALPKNPVPEYPKDAQERRQEGKGVLKLSIDAEGNVTSAVLHKTCGFEALDRSALEAHRRWKFQPARRDGKAISIECYQPFEFRLAPPASPPAP